MRDHQKDPRLTVSFAFIPDGNQFFPDTLDDPVIQTLGALHKEFTRIVDAFETLCLGSVVKG